MSNDLSLEQRLAALESVVADLQRRLAAPADHSNWLAKIAGSFKDEPEFAQVLAYGREFRQSDRPTEEGSS